MYGTALRRDQSETFHLLEQVELKRDFWQYMEPFCRRTQSFLLDSAKESSQMGSFSFLATDPFLTFSAKRAGNGPIAGANIVIRRSEHLDDAPEPVVIRKTADPLEELRTLLKEFAVPETSLAGRPVPLLAGAVGYFAYEAGYFVETLPDLGRDDLGLPDIHFGFFDVILAHHHAGHESYLSVVGRGPNRNQAGARARQLFNRRLREIRDFEKDSPAFSRTKVHPAGYTATDADAVPISYHFDRSSYGKAVEKCKQHIHCGDAFEICLTHRMQAPFAGEDAWQLYSALRAISPSSFAGFLNIPGAQVVSSSPERFLRLGPDRMAESCPIKGTRRRGKTPDEDTALFEDLRDSVKDRAENMMIVDLVRNDLGRVCDIGTVHVPNLMNVERLTTLFQMSSTVRGRLRPDMDAIDLVKAAFPGGSMTGAPKVEAMKIIDRLEPVKRGIYSGSIGYIDFSGTMDLNIVIRTFILCNGQAFFNTGGAIVADSDPGQEYQETMDKAYALKLALCSLRAR
jgi:aminodeoxychorismate synthase component I